jgi:CECR6/TMEM121 family
MSFPVIGKKPKADGDAGESKEKKIGGELPLGYVAWGLYSVILASKIGLLFGVSQYIAYRISSESALDGNVLRTALSLSSIIFFTLVTTHDDSPDKSERKVYACLVYSYLLFVPLYIACVAFGPTHFDHLIYRVKEPY